MGVYEGNGSDRLAKDGSDRFAEGGSERKDGSNWFAKDGSEWRTDRDNGSDCVQFGLVA